MNTKRVCIFEDVVHCDYRMCAPDPNIVLVEFTDTINRLKQEYPNIEIMRVNLSHRLDSIRLNVDVLMMIKSKSIDVLPLITINGEIYSQQRYPNYEELKSALEIQL